MENEPTTKRTFFSWLIMSAAGVIGAALAVPLAGYVVSPALKRRVQGWVNVGLVQPLPVNVPIQRDLVMTIADGYMEVSSVKGIWALRRENGEVTVYSPICLHASRMRISLG